MGRMCITRPHPGIDRVSSAWLIVRYIDPQAKFIFDADPKRHPNAAPFDMFNTGGFGHIRNDCTFETLLKSFGIKDSRLKLLAQAVHDADLADECFGRSEALGIDRILDGWNKEGVPQRRGLGKGHGDDRGTLQGNSIKNRKEHTYDDKTESTGIFAKFYSYAGRDCTKCVSDQRVAGS
jgi:hypothetical protein